VRVRGVTTTVVAMAAMAAFTVSGCSGSAEPSELDSGDQGKSEPGNAKSPSPTPEEEQQNQNGDVEIGSDDEVPSGAEADSAVQFVEQYVAAENKAYRTGDVSQLENMTGEHCLDCNETITYIEATYGKGNRLEGYQLEDPTVELQPGRPEGAYLVQVSGERTAWQVYDASGNPDPNDKGGSEQSDVTFSVTKVDGAWQIIGG
jgi:Family of unknown function (DUF6318)